MFCRARGYGHGLQIRAIVKPQNNEKTGKPKNINEERVTHIVYKTRWSI